MAKPRQTPFACQTLPARQGRADWRDMETGKVRQRPSRSRERAVAYYIDFWPDAKGSDRFLNSDRGNQFESEHHAETIRRRICGLTDKGHSLAEAISTYRQPKDKRNRVLSLADRWIKFVEANEGEDGYAPYTVRDYRGMVANHFQWWGARTIDEVTWQALDEWLQVLRRTLGRKRQKYVLTAFRAFLRW